MRAGSSDWLALSEDDDGETNGDMVDVVPADREHIEGAADEVVPWDLPPNDIPTGDADDEWGSVGEDDSFGLDLEIEPGFCEDEGDHQDDPTDDTEPAAEVDALDIL